MNDFIYIKLEKDIKIDKLKEKELFEKWNKDGSFWGINDPSKKYIFKFSCWMMNDFGETVKKKFGAISKNFKPGAYPIFK